MPRDFREELKRIVEFLNVDDYDAERLWIVLAALRGPDENAHRDGVYIKHATTAVLRHAIGLKVRDLDIDADDDNKVTIRNEMQGWSHFKSHIQDAFLAMGLWWGANNTVETTPEVIDAT